VYILECGDGSFYVGATTDLEKRVAEHQNGFGGRYTAFRQPVELVFSYETASLDGARVAEQQLKGWRRAKRLALIRGDYEALVALARTAREREV
jgi:predicted GIY-YIG superfamily endonuclease